MSRYNYLNFAYGVKIKSPQEVGAKIDTHSFRILTKSHLINVLRTEPNIHQDFQQYLSEYYLLYWTGRYFQSQIIEGSIQNSSGKYLIVYNRITPEIAFKHHQLALSFRKPKPEFNLPAYVIVSIAR